MSGPLEGVHVLEVAGYTFVPAGGAALADLGADVIKVEPPTGDAARWLENALTRALNQQRSTGPGLFMEFGNRGKRSIVLDLQKPKARNAFHELVEWSDVFITNYLPEVREKLDIDVDAMRAVNPRLIYVRGSGWGPKGPMRNRPGFDLAASWASSGAAHRFTAPDGEPLAMPAGFFDLQGAQALAGATAMALFKRERTGEPSVVDVSLLNVSWWTMQPDIIAAPFTENLGGMVRTSPGNPLVNWYRTADDRWLYLVLMQADRFWAELCQVMDRDDLLIDERFIDADVRFENREACVAELDLVFRSRTLDEWAQRFAGFSGVWAPAITPIEAHEHPQGIANGYLAEHVAGDGFKLKLVAPPAQFDEQPTVPQGPAPELGQHTEEVLLELGYSWDDIAELRDCGGIG
jgi:formyl-CoA transferase